MNPEEAKAVEIQIDLGISEQANKAIEYLESGDSKAFRAVKNYFSVLIEKLKGFDISRDDEVTYDLIFERTNQMIPARNEFINVITTIAEFEEHTKFYTKIHEFFENLLPYFSYRNEGESTNRLAANHYEAFGSELFLYTVATLLKSRRFEQLNELTNQGYYHPLSTRRRRDKFIPFNEFNRKSEALAGYYYNKHIGEEFYKATHLKERLFESRFSYEDLAQADFVLHVISLLDKRTNEEFFYSLWNNQVHTDSYPFELFVRSESLWFFKKFTKCLRGVSKDDISDFIELYNRKMSESGRYYGQLDWEHKMALTKIATRA